MRGLVRATRTVVAGGLAVVGTFAISQVAVSQQSNQELATALRSKHVALATGLRAAAAKGKPISAKYEYEGGRLQLSVYTEKGGAFSEVIVNHKTGKVAKSEKITEGDDLKDAQAQSAAVAKAKSSVLAALERALSANKGYSAVSAVASIKDGKPVAEITIIKGTEFKTVTESLD